MTSSLDTASYPFTLIEEWKEIREHSNGEHVPKHLKHLTGSKSRRLQYTSHTNNSLVGKQINISQYINHDQILIDLNTHDMDSFVFVTAASSNHFLYTIKCIGSIQIHYPRHKIIYYDLGLNEDEIKRVST